MNIVYVHGYGSQFNRDNEKVAYLETIGTVTGPDLNYDIKYSEEIVRKVVDFTINAHADLIVGISLGGWVAAEVAHRVGILFVAINPAIEPYKSLDKYGVSQVVLNTYQPMSLKGAGLVIVDRDDEVLNSQRTLNYVRDEKPTISYEGGHHRFAHMKEALPSIKEFCNVSSNSLGFN